MTLSEDEADKFSQFLESEVISHLSDQEEDEEEPQAKRLRRESEDSDLELNLNRDRNSGRVESNDPCKITPRRIESGILNKIPPELFTHILKFLSSEDLIACSRVCTFLNFAASDESLWRRLYCMRWGLSSPTKLRQCPWKKLYFQRDEEDMAQLVRNGPSEFKEYYIQMQAAKRSQAPLPSQLKDDRIILDKTVADQVAIWRTNHGLNDEMATGHSCSGETCSYHQIGDVYVCEKTGRVHVCDDTCREVVLDPTNDQLVCTISGHCYDRLYLQDETEQDTDQQQGGGPDEAEPFMGSGRFARAYYLGYNCADEKELEYALKFC